MGEPIRTVAIGGLLAVTVAGSPAWAACDLVQTPPKYCTTAPTQCCGGSCQNPNPNCPSGCEPAKCLSKTPNVILIIADDLGWQDLPFFAPPTQWANSYPTPAGENRSVMRPTINRTEARLMANQTTGQLGTSPLLNALVHGGIVFPLDAPNLNGAASHVYQIAASQGAQQCNGVPCRCDGSHLANYEACIGATCCNYKIDVLEGFGGLNRLATQGNVFPHVYSTAPWCAPARSSIMTGRHKRRTGVGGNESPGLDPDEVTIAAYLRTGCQQNTDPCYTTGLIGKWHLGFGGQTDPWDKGFVEAISHSESHRDYFGKDFVCGGSTPGCSDPAGGTYSLPTEKKKDDRLTAWWCNDNDGSTIATNSDKCRFSARVYRDLAIDFIERHRLDAAPFLLVLAVNTVHTTHDAPERTKQHYQQTAPQAPAMPRHAPGRSATYWALIEELDASVGKILEKLDHPATVDSLGTPLKSNTLVLFTSDHGAPANPYGIPMLRGGKGGSYDGGQRVPFLARACNHPPAQMLSPVLDARTFSHTDIFPTIAEAARQPVNPVDNKIPSPSGLHYIEGRSFYQLLLPSPAAGVTRNYTYFEKGPAAIVSRESTGAPENFHNADKVCSYEGVTPGGMPVRGASCTSCPTGNCTGQCTLLGKVCCLSGDVSGKVCGSPAQQTLQRCSANSHCGSGYQCVETGVGTVACNQCKAARWKLRTNKLTNTQACNALQPTDLEFFDLTSNPEEDERINCRKQPTWETRYCGMFAKLKSWNNCVWSGESSCEVQ